MNEEYKLEFTKKYIRKYAKLVSKDKRLRQQIIDSLKILRVDPFDLKLGSHKVNLKEFGKVYSSCITGDVRIIWELESSGSVRIIFLLDIGGHSGSKGVYK